MMPRPTPSSNADNEKDSRLLSHSSIKNHETFEFGGLLVVGVIIDFVRSEKLNRKEGIS